MKTVSLDQSCRKPSSAGVKKRGHFALVALAQGSRVNANSAFNWSNTGCGVVQSSVAVEKSAFHLSFAMGAILSGNCPASLKSSRLVQRGDEWIFDFGWATPQLINTAIWIQARGQSNFRMGCLGQSATAPKENLSTSNRTKAGLTAGPKVRVALGLVNGPKTD